MYNRGGAHGGGGRPMGGRSGGLLGRSPNKQIQDRHAGQMSTGMKRMLGGGGNNSGLMGSAPRQHIDYSMAYNVDRSYSQHDDQHYDQAYSQREGYASTEDYREAYGGVDVNADYDTQQSVYATSNHGQLLNEGGQRYAKGQGRQGFQGGQSHPGYNDGQRRLSQPKQGFQSGQGSRQDVGMGRTRQAYQQEEVYNDYNEAEYLDQDYGGVGVEGATRENYSGGWDAYGGDKQTGSSLLPAPSPRNFSANQGGNPQIAVPRNNSRNREMENKPRNVGRGKQVRSSEQQVGAPEEPRDTYTLLSQASRGRGLLRQQAHVANRPGLLGQPTLGNRRGIQSQPTAGGRMNPDQQGMMSTQADLMQKAEMQMRMIQQEEEREAVMMQQKLLREQEQIEDRRRAEEMQALLETQQRALMLQQNDHQMRRGQGAGLLGDGPIQGNSPGGLAQNRSRRGPGIPSIFDVRGSGKTSQLGKRPSLTVARANIAAKRARQESQNRNANKPRRSSPTRRGRDKSRGGQRKSRFEQSPSSKHRDRKESESRKSSSGQMSSGKDHSRSRGRDSRNDDKTEVKVTTEAYDPANPTGDYIDMKSTKDDDVKITGVEVPKEDKEVPMETNLTVTFSKKGRSVNDSDSKGVQERRKEQEKKYKCNVCDVKCFDEESFSRHMNGLKHKNKMEKLTTTSNQTTPLLVARKQAEEHLRQIEMKRGGVQSKPPGKTMESHCKVCNEMFTGAYKDHKEVPKHQAKEDRRKAGCKVCKVTSFNSYGDFLKHLDSAWHKKKLKQASWAECKICNQKFKSPRKFVLHCKTDHHIENKKQSGEADGPDDLGDLVTLDTVGFEEESQSENKSEPKTDVTAPVKTEEPEDIALGDYEPSKAVGQELVISVSGFFCKLCHKFYNNESAAKGSHCQSQAHFEKYKKYLNALKLKRQLSDSKQVEDTKTSSGESSGNSQDASSQSTGQTTGGGMSQNRPSDKVDQFTNGNDDSIMQQDDQGDMGTANESFLSQSDVQEDMETSDAESKLDDENEIKIEILSKTKGGPSTRGMPSNRGRRGGGRRQLKKRV